MRRAKESKRSVLTERNNLTERKAGQARKAIAVLEQTFTCKVLYLPTNDLNENPVVAISVLKKGSEFTHSDLEKIGTVVGGLVCDDGFIIVMHGEKAFLGPDPCDADGSKHNGEVISYYKVEYDLELTAPAVA